MTVLVKYHREIVLAQCYISHYFGIVFTKLCVNVHVHVKKTKKNIMTVWQHKILHVGVHNKNTWYIHIHIYLLYCNGVKSFTFYVLMWNVRTFMAKKKNWTEIRVVYQNLVQHNCPLTLIHVQHRVSESSATYMYNVN